MRNYYANTAYDSRKTYDRIECSDNRWTPHRMNGHILKWGVDFGSFMAASDHNPEDFQKYKETFHDSSYEKHSPYYKFIDSGESVKKCKANGLNHDHMVVVSRQSWAMALALIFFLSRISLIIFPLAGVLLSIRDGKWSGFFDPASLLTMLILAVVTFLSWMALKKGWVKFPVKAIFFRSTGEVYVYHNKYGSAESCHFTEFDGFINSTPSRSGVLYYSLEITHRQKRELRIPASDDDPIKKITLMRWELIQEFMDISKPLPDIPELEPFRHLDPVTAEWDKKHNRPPDLYEKMSNKTFVKYQDKLVWEYEKGFQWGSDRWLSEAEGWEPPPEEWWLVPVDDAQASVA